MKELGVFSWRRTFGESKIPALQKLKLFHAKGMSFLMLRSWEQWVKRKTESWFLVLYKARVGSKQTPTRVWLVKTVAKWRAGAPAKGLNHWGALACCCCIGPSCQI